MKGQTFVGMLVFLQLFLHQGAYSNWKEGFKKSAFQQMFGPSCFDRTLLFGHEIPCPPNLKIKIKFELGM